MALRQAGDWLTSYLEYCSDTEPPEMYHIWTGVSVIASTLQRKVFIRQGHEKIYPNMYIVLVGPSGRCRKGTAMGIGLDLLSNLKEVKLSAESITREALIRRMKDSTFTINDIENPNIIKTHCSMSIFSEELSVFLRQNDLNFLSNLTNWYDSRDRWEYETKGSGKDTLEGVCVNLLGGTAPDWIQTMLPREAIGGGFTSRIIFVVEEKKKQTSPEPIMDSVLKEQLVSDLESMIQIKGEFQFASQARDIYENWYAAQDVNNALGKSVINDPRFAGYCDRRQTHIRKLCMVISASRGNDRMINTDDFERARKILEQVEKRMDRTFGGLGENRYGQATERVMRYIEGKKSVLRSELMKVMYRDVDPETLAIIEKTLEQMKHTRVTLIPDKGDVRYDLIK